MWILFYQTSSGRVKFVTSDMDFTSSMDYWKFLKFVQENFKLHTFNEMRNKLDSFETILAFQNGDWEVQEKDPFVPEQYTMKDLLPLNENKLENYNTGNQKREVNRHNDDFILEMAERLKNDKLSQFGLSKKMKSDPFNKKQKFGFIGRFFK